MIATLQLTEATDTTTRDDNHVALARLLIFVTGKTHEMLGDLASTLRKDITSNADAEGKLGGRGLLSARKAIEREWDDFFARWEAMFEALRREAAAIPFGMLAVAHEEWMVAGIAALEELTLLDVIFGPHVNGVLDAAGRRVYGDGLNWSARVWNLNNGTQAEMQRRVLEGVARNDGAWEIANDLEQYLGAGQDCPRWTRTRLRLTKAEIASGNRAGLYSGDECRSQGVAYRALRLARNELQVIHAMATDAAMAKMPWVERERIALSASHPTGDVCDDVAGGGDDADGVYPKGEIRLPLHVQCVTPGQIVKTRRGNVPIEQVRMGDEVLTDSGRYREVVRVWSREHDGVLYRMKTKHGYVELTGEHPVLLRRGWVEAQLLEPGDEIAYTPVSTFRVDPLTGVTDDEPSAFSEPAVTPGVVVGAALVPASSVALDSHTDVDDSKVDKVASNVMFSIVGDALSIKRLHHSNLKAGRVGETLFTESQQHGHKTWVVPPLGGGDFSSGIGMFAGGDGTVSKATATDLAHFSARRFVTIIIPFPGRSNSLAPASHRNITQREKSAQHAVSKPVLLEDGRGTEFLVDIDVKQELCDGASLFGFDAEPVEFRCGDPVLVGVSDDEPRHASPANGAFNSHNNLLFDYVTIDTIERVHYIGPVYNLSVVDDNSYTVNGFVVHNCLCYKLAVLMKPDDFAAKLRAWTNSPDTWPEMNDYEDFIGGSVRVSLLGLAVVGTLGAWLSGSWDDLEGEID